MISAFEGLEKRVIEDICQEIGANIVGYIQLTNDYQIEFTNNKTLSEISDIADYLNSYSFISTVTLNMSSDVKIEVISNDAEYRDDTWDEQEKRFHVYYRNKEVSEKGKIVAKLDLDDTSSYGPETVTNTVNANVIKNGSKLMYSVHDYTNKNQNDSTILSNSGATIHVYSGNILIKTFSVPNGKKGNVWKVFEITNGEIKSVNEFYNCSDPSEVK